MRGNDNLRKFTILKIENVKLLPVAHTCFNRLDLPNYKNYSKLKYNLDLVMKEDYSTGFSLQ